MSGIHGQLTADNGIHYPWAWVWNDATDRGNATAESTDLYKVGYQIDTNTLWICTDPSVPTFVLFNPTYSEANVSNPPTAAELNAAFPSAYAGFQVLINDAGAATNAYHCWFDGTDWWIHTATVAA